jgi:serine/threonine protein kinase
MTMPVKQGDVLAGKYRVEHVLGEGGMGVVVCARHMQLESLVALKFMLPQAAEDKESVGRFLREARAAARLRGEHVARVTDVGTLETGAPYLVMEYLDGKDLAASLAADGRPSIPQAAEYIVQACEALEEAHTRGIVHRDIKPSNLFLTKKPNGQPSIKVLDFGISKLAPSGASSGAGASLNATSTKAVFGSPLYMAPEQMRSAAKVDARADVWSLGATLYELLTGRVPFLAESIMELCLKVAQEPPDPLREIRPDVPAELEAIVTRCLSKDPAARFASAADLSVALTPYAVKRRPSMVDDGEVAETDPAPVPAMTGAMDPRGEKVVSEPPPPQFEDSAFVDAAWVDPQRAASPSSPAASTQKSASEVAIPLAAKVPTGTAALDAPLPQLSAAATGANWGKTNSGASNAPPATRRAGLFIGGAGAVVVAALIAVVATNRDSRAPANATAVVAASPAPSPLPAFQPVALPPLALAPSSDPTPSASVAPPSSPPPVPSTLISSTPVATEPLTRPKAGPALRPNAGVKPASKPSTPAHDYYSNPN